MTAISKSMQTSSRPDAMTDAPPCRPADGRRPLPSVTPSPCTNRRGVNGGVNFPSLGEVIFPRCAATRSGNGRLCGRFGRAAAATRRRGESGKRSEAEIFRDQIGVLAQAIARALDMDDNGVVKQPVEQSGSDDGMAEELAPFGEAAV